MKFFSKGAALAIVVIINSILLLTMAGITLYTKNTESLAPAAGVLIVSNLVLLPCALRN